MWHLIDYHRLRNGDPQSYRVLSICVKRSSSRQAFRYPEGAVGTGKVEPMPVFVPRLVYLLVFRT